MPGSTPTRLLGALAAFLGAAVLVGSPAAAEAAAKHAEKPGNGCAVDAEGSLSGKRSFELEAESKRGRLDGELEFRDKAAKLEFESTEITSLVVAGKLASVQGRGRAKAKRSPALRFSATLDAAARTFELRLGDGYSASSVLADKDDDDEIELEGFCPFDGGSTPVLDTSRRVSATIGRAGGTLAAGGLTLAIPAGALSEDTRIALTPLADLADSPLAGSIVGGAKLEPEGLRFLRPAVLSFALPAGVPAADVIGFGSAGDGSELHLQPHSVSGGTISLQLWHFSTAGGSSGGSSASAALQTRTISNAERQALQRIAAAHRACNAEVAQGIFAGPACADVRAESVRALFEWYTNAVRPGLEQAAAALSFEAEEALAEWLAWNAEVFTLFRNDPAGTPRCGTLENECVQAHGLATAAVAAHAKRRLENCTGTSLVAQLRDVARMADYAAAGTIRLTSLQLPDAANGNLLRACASIRIDEPVFPAFAARLKPNRLSVRASIATYTGAQMPGQLQLTLALTNAGVDSSSALLDQNGRFATNVYPLEGAIGVVVDITVELAESALPQLTDALLRENFTSTHEVASPARERLLFVAQGPTTVTAGGTLDLLVLVAGDGMTDPVTLTVGGPGTVGPTPVTPNSEGAATATYTASSSTVNPNAQVIATLSDGTSASIPITIAAPVTVTLNPSSATLPTGGTQDFTATVNNSPLGVTWSATGGDIVTTGSTTARYDARSTPGTFSVTATSITDPTKSATATIVIAPPAAGRVTLVARGGGTFARTHAVGLFGSFEGGVALPIDADDSDSDSPSDTSLASYLVEAFAAATAGDLIVASGVGSASAQLDLTATPAKLFAFAAGQAQASSAGGGHPSVLGNGLARVFFNVTFDVSVASVPYSLDMLLAADPGNECRLSFRRLLPTPATLATGTSDVSEGGTLSPGRYDLKIECEASSSSPGGNPAGDAGYLGQLEVGA